MVESPFVVRVAGLPVSALTGLSSPRLLAAVREVLALDEWLPAEGAALADELHGVIGGLVHPEPRPGLVGLRRALFRGRAPRTAEWTTEIAAALPDELRERVRRWCARLAERSVLAAELSTVVDQESARTERALLAAAGDPLFRHGLAQSSPTLSAELEKWLVRGDGRVSRQVLVRMARYVSRAAAKTSPYSTFTSIGAGSWTEEEAEPLTVRPDLVPRGQLEFHGALLFELDAALSTSDELRRALVVRVNPSLTMVGDRYLAIGAPPAEGAASVAAVPEVTNCLRVLGDGWLRLGELYDRLAEGAPRDATGRVTAFVDRLIEIGVLELRVPVDDQCRDRLGAIAEWLQREGGALWAGTARACAELSALLTPPTDLEDVDGHRARLDRVRHATAMVRAEADLPDEPDTRDFVHEHTVFTTPAATANLPAWRDALADLDHVRRWMAVHDPELPLRLALGAYCAARFGRGASVPFVVLHRALLADLEAREAGAELTDLRAQLKPQPSIQDSRLPVLRELTRLRRRSINAVLGVPPDADGVIRLDPVRLTESATGLPDYVWTASSVAWFVQADGTRLVLNSAVCGHGRGRARSLRLIAEANAGTLPAGLEPSTSDSATVVADSSGLFGHTLNQRLSIAGRELDYPFTVHQTRQRPRIPVRDLTVEHDPASGLARLRHAVSGSVVTPVHTGMMAEFLLPFGLQLLVRGLGAAPTLCHPGGLLADDRAVEDVSFAPRIEVGQVVLRRATWSVAGTRVPRRAPGEPDHDLFLRLHGWLAGQGIPDRCFVRASAPPDPSWLRSAFTKTRKPLYVDFSSPWLVTMFERMIAGPTERVVFREALPPLTQARGGRVSELVIETAENLAGVPCG